MLTHSTEQLKVLINEAKSRNLFFMEALWTRFQPAVRYLQQKVLPKIEPIIHVELLVVEHGGNSRLLKPDLGGGALLDIGVYPLNLISIAFNDQKPKSIEAVACVDDNNIDRVTAVQFKYKDDAAGNLFCTIEAETPDDCIIIGKHGYVRLHAPFWCTTRITVKTPADSKEITYDFPINDDDRKKYNFENRALMVHEIQHCCERFTTGKKESNIYPLSYSVHFMEILDEIRKQTGIDYGKQEKAK